MLRYTLKRMITREGCKHEFITYEITTDPKVVEDALKRGGYDESSSDITEVVAVDIFDERSTPIVGIY
jgi:hypothetical protein